MITTTWTDAVTTPMCASARLRTLAPTAPHQGTGAPAYGALAGTVAGGTGASGAVAVATAEKRGPAESTVRSTTVRTVDVPTLVVGDLPRAWSPPV
ncbi:hypothetical protein [Vallicoccus soli]|uniref:Uncharacterized protein n=1 Tax=Vallicoccus soli TaxID=2339232 RepID=A0A3A3Z3U5_9ACTN|nr:hypothetical protein [Vallicoccus soli]RJK98084.1 hypothetical protein D5H78_03890 [Vallicoccus soli]